MKEKDRCSKLEIAKVYQENLKILTLMILTIGAGIGAVLFKENIGEMPRIVCWLFLELYY